jgi:hypothetical protein
MIAMHEAAGGFHPIAGPLGQVQPHEWRIDILRHLWLEQVEQTKAALQLLGHRGTAPTVPAGTST